MIRSAGFLFDKILVKGYYPSVKITLVIPTYNERGNIQLIIKALLDQFRTLHHEFQILIVDDKSPDGTWVVVVELQKSIQNLHLLLGNKQGLGSAYTRGFKYALDKLRSDVIVEMDADFSHQPSELPKLLEQIEKGADFVIGSRYIRGGKVPKNWHLFRKINSRWGNRFARYLAGIDDVYDCTSGFRAIRTQVLRKIDLDKLKVRGYSFQMNLLYKAYVLGAKITEVPIDFRERVVGYTKLGPSDIAEFMWNSVKLRFEQGWQGLDKRALRAAAKKTLSAGNKDFSRSEQTIPDEQVGDFPLG